MARDIFKEQSQLSQYIQLLYQLHYSEPQKLYQDLSEHSNKHSRDDKTNTTLRILDTIAVALTTGKKGEVFAVGLDKAGGLKLVLAKNEPHTREDDEAVRRLLNILTHPKTEGATQVFHFLLSRCKQNIKKRVRKMLEFLDAFSIDFKETVEAYDLKLPSPSVTAKEFPDSVVYRNMNNLGENPPFLPTMRSLWSDISVRAQGFIALTEGGDSHSQVESFRLLAVLVAVLEKSPFLQSLCNPIDTMIHPDRQSRAERLKRRLVKVCQYYQGIHKLVHDAKRFLTRSISHCWVSPITGTGERTVQLDHYSTIISHALHLQPSSDDAKVGLQKRFPELDKNWPRNLCIQTCVHAEIRILLHLDESPNPPNRHARQPIGCSKRSCLCCTLWINKYNESAHTMWLTSGSHGKSYTAWALPGQFRADGTTSNGRLTAYAAVTREVKWRLADCLALLPPGEGRVSDEH